jgi:hypothetical protein
MKDLQPKQTKAPRPPRGTLPGRVKAPEDKLSPAGRPRIEPQPGAAEVIEKACKTGASRQGVAMALGISNHVLARWLSEYPDIKEAFERGRERERKVLHDALTAAATKGNIVAAIFLLKARHGYREGDQGDSANRVSITFNMPGAMPLDKFMTVENGTDPVQQLPNASASSTRRA